MRLVLDTALLVLVGLFQGFQAIFGGDLNWMDLVMCFSAGVALHDLMTEIYVETTPGRPEDGPSRAVRGGQE